MTEKELIEAVGLVARLRRYEQKKEEDAAMACRHLLGLLGVVVPPRAWSPPVTASDDDLA